MEKVVPRFNTLFSWRGASRVSMPHGSPLCLRAEYEAITGKNSHLRPRLIFGHLSAPLKGAEAKLSLRGKEQELNDRFATRMKRKRFVFYLYKKYNLVY